MGANRDQDYRGGQAVEKSKCIYSRFPSLPPMVFYINCLPAFCCAERLPLCRKLLVCKAEFARIKSVL